MGQLSAITGNTPLKAAHAKILLAILAALLAIAGALAYRRHELVKAAVLRERKEYEMFLQQAEKDKQKHSSAAANEGKVWRKYIP